MKSEKKQISIINTLKLFAILIVFNSHCAQLYPVSYMATGGAVGNSIFFAISGFLLKINDDESFFKYLWKKIIRLYPAVYLTSLINMAYFGDFPGSINEWYSQIVWPTRYWFVGAMIVFYIWAWAINKMRFTEHIVLYNIIMVLLYFAVYILIVDKTKWSVEAEGLSNVSGWVKCIHYFYVFTIGFFIRKYYKDNKKQNILKPSLYALIFLIGFLAQLVLKYCMVKSIVPYLFQFVVQAIDILCAVAILLFVLKISKVYDAKISKIDVQKLIDMLSAASLEMYFMQFLLIDLCTRMPFPINSLAAFIGTALVSLIINKICAYVRI